MAGKVTRLKLTETEEVSLVPAGANRKTFLIVKEDSEKMEIEKLVEMLGKTILNEKQVAKIEEALKGTSLSATQQEALKGAMRLLTSLKEVDGVDGVLKALKDMMPGTAYAEPYVPPSKGEDKKYPAPYRKEDGTWDFSKVPSEALDAVKAVAKELDAASDANAKMIARVSELEKATKDASDAVLSAKFAKEAEGFKKLPVEAAKFGGVLREISEKCSKETTAEVARVLRAADDLAGKADATKEIGSGGGSSGSGDAYSRIEARAKELVAKSAEKGESLTREAAISRVLKADPALYDDYRKEAKTQSN